MYIANLDNVSQRICVFYDVPCDVVYENYPNDEDSYSVNIHWNKASKTKGKVPIELFPNYPQESEYKSYFDYMRANGQILCFHNIWKDDLFISIVKQIDLKHDEARIESVIKEFSL